MEWLSERLSWFYSEYSEYVEIVLRLVIATFAGMAIGLNRDLHNKPIGMRTLGLVSLSSAAVVLAGSVYADIGDLRFAEDAVSRVIQGILTGLGFLGAGVILRERERMEVHGLTTAATVWIAAVFGVAAGLGAWFITVAGTTIALFLLIFGKALEQRLGRFFSRGEKPVENGSEGEPERGNRDGGHRKP